MVVVEEVCILIQMTLVSVVDQEVAAVLTLEHLLEVWHHHLVKAMLVAVVLAINPVMLVPLAVVVALVPQVPMAVTFLHNLATVELVFCGLMVIIMLVVVVVETGQQAFLLAMVD
jgi:hypothetical protein